MGKVDPYHTTTEEEPKQRDVYHDYSECPDGKRILAENKKPGKAGRPRCDACIDLD
jgi:hypothetical protein